MKVAQQLFSIIFLILLQSCNSQEKKGNKNNGTMQQPFDLANLTLNENIDDILLTTHTSLNDTIIVNDYTYLGNQRVAFFKKNILVFNGAQLFNKNDEIKSQVLFHYGKIDKELGAFHNEKDDILGMYQLNLNTKKESELLFVNLNSKLGKCAFTKTREGFIADIKENNLIPTKDKFNEEVFIWKKNELIYYYFKSEVENKPKQYFCKLFVFKFNHKEWVSFLSTSSYPEANEILSF